MNLILLTKAELDAGLDHADERIIHIRDVLKCGPEDWFDIGIIDGARGKARMTLSEDGSAVFDYSMGEAPPDLFPITLIVGMPRPQTARRLLREMTSIGVRRLWFAVTDRSEKGYASSKLWTTDEYKRHVKQGAEQAFCTRLPDVQRFDSLNEAVAAASAQGDGDRIALDNYEAKGRLAEWHPTDNGGGVTLVLGAERGWSGSERDMLRTNDYDMFDLGNRVLRVETAAIAASTIVLAKLGVM
jgi:RsmE family RNA methyltransferase